MKEQQSLFFFYSIKIFYYVHLRFIIGDVKRIFLMNMSFKNINNVILYVRCVDMNNQKISIFYAFNNKYYKYGEIQIKYKADGSIYLLLPGNTKNEKGKLIKRKVSIHSSGRVNYDTPDSHKIFLNPLYLYKNDIPIIGVYVPNLEALEPVNGICNASNNIVFKIDFSENILTNFFLSSNKINAESNLLYICVTDKLSIIISTLNGKYDERCKEKVRWYYPGVGNQNHQLMNKYEALQLFYATIYEKNGLKVIGPDNKGEIKIIFEQVMHRIPLLKIEFLNPNYYAVPLKGSCVYLTFMVKNRKKNDAIVMDPNKIKIKSLMISCEPGIEDTEEGKSMVKFDNIWK